MTFPEAVQCALGLFSPLSILRIDNDGGRVLMERAKAEHVDAWMRIELETEWDNPRRRADLRAFGEFYTFVRPHFSRPEQTLGEVVRSLGWTEDGAAKPKPA